MDVTKFSINQKCARKVIKGATLKERISSFMLSKDEKVNNNQNNDFRVEDYSNIANYYRRNSYENCHYELIPVLNRLYSDVFGENMFVYEPSNAPLPGKDSTKDLSMVELAHMVSKFTRNSKDYPQDSIEEIKYVLDVLGEKAENIKKINEAPMESYIDSFKSVFNADLIVQDGNYYRVEYVKNIETFIKTFFDNPQSLGFKDVDERMFRNRDIEPGDVREEDIEAKYNEFLRKINTNMFGVNGKNTVETGLYLANLIKLKDQQDKNEVEQMNRKIPYEDFFGREHLYDPSDPEHPWNRGKK